MSIAYKITGELNQESSIGLINEIYPTGAHIRGALGYIFLDMGLEEISKTYIQQVNPILYFRDCLCKCKTDGGDLLPLVRQDVVKGRVIKEIIYMCNKCGTVNRNPVSRDRLMGNNITETGNANTFVNEIISNTERSKFKFEVILKESKNKDKDKNKDKESNLVELMAVIKFIENNGFYVGKRKNKGLGKMTLKNVSVSEIGMEEISKRSDEIENKVKKDNGVMTIKLVSDYIGKSPISVNDLLRDIKNTAKFFHPHWHEIRDEYKDPVMSLIGKNIEYDERKTVYFLDCKVNEGNDNIKLDKTDFVVNRGTQYSYQISNVDKIDSSFWNAVAMTEMVRGIGDRTSFGKGQIVVS